MLLLVFHFLAIIQTFHAISSLPSYIEMCDFYNVLVDFFYMLNIVLCSILLATKRVH